MKNVPAGQKIVSNGKLRSVRIQRAQIKELPLRNSENEPPKDDSILAHTRKCVILSFENFQVL